MPRLPEIFSLLYSCWSSHMGCSVVDMHLLQQNNQTFTFWHFKLFNCFVHLCYSTCVTFGFIHSCSKPRYVTRPPYMHVDCYLHRDHQRLFISSVTIYKPMFVFYTQQSPKATPVAVPGPRGSILVNKGIRNRLVYHLHSLEGTIHQANLNNLFILPQTPCGSVMVMKLTVFALSSQSWKSWVYKEKGGQEWRHPRL